MCLAQSFKGTSLGNCHDKYCWQIVETITIKKINKKIEPETKLTRDILIIYGLRDNLFIL